MFIRHLQKVQSIIWAINKTNILESVESIKKLYGSNFPNSFMFTICQIIFSSFISQRKDINTYIQFMKTLSTVFTNKLFDIFADFLISMNCQESNYLLGNLIIENLINKNTVRNIKSLTFAPYKIKDEFNVLKISYKNIYKGIYKIFSDKFFDDIKELSKNDWELHKKLIKEGVNPNEVSRIIRNDEIEKLQDISSQTNFDYNQTIEPSLYERYSFINEENVSLIDYAAFFGSIKCFKYLLLNNANIENTGKYAIAGGNLEIVHLCEQNQITIANASEIAIEFHRNEIFYYFFEKKNVKDKELVELGKKCVLFNNYEILSFLLGKGLKTNDLITESAKNGNIFLFLYSAEGNQLPKDILILAAKSGNAEIVKYLIEQKGININIKNAYFLFLRYISIF